MNFNIRDGLTYDDILLVPQYSTIKSRSDVDVSVKLGCFKYKHPIIPANMKTITGMEMAFEVCKSGGLAILHRFMKLEEQVDIANNILDNFNEKNFAVSVGVKPEDLMNFEDFLNAGVKIFCIDIAHGDSSHCVDMIKKMKKINSQIYIIAGNVATGSGARRLWEAGADVVKCGIGPGCFAAGTRVLMHNGLYKNIEDIIPGDYVINKNGKSVKVLDVFSTGIRKVVKLKNNSFYNDTYVTPDHQFWVGDLSSISQKTLLSQGYLKVLDKKSKTIPKQSKYKWKSITDAQDDVLLFPKNIEFKMPEHFEIILNKREGGNNKTNFSYSKDSAITPNYDSGYLFGTFLGDGCASCEVHNGSHTGHVKWYFRKEEIDIVNKVLKSIKNIFDKEASIIETKNTIDVVFYYKPLADFLFTFGKKENKRLPDNLFVNNKEYLSGLYDGLLDSDGHYAKDNRNSISNTSIRIIELFNILNFILNKNLPNSTFKGKKIGGLKECNVENMNDLYFSRTLKNGEKRLTENYQVIKILNYEEINLEMPVYDITVDCDTHSFIANNMIVHNSLCTTRIETGNGVPQLTALMDVAKAQQELIALYRTKDNHEKNREFPIIADGGIKNTGDVIKALCFADMVMVGNLFAGCMETPGQIMQIDGKTYKEYVGSSTHKTNYVEGVAAIVPTKGKYQDILNKLLEGLRSGMSYQGVSNLIELRDNPEFIRITNAGLRESHPHDINLK